MIRRKKALILLAFDKIVAAFGNPPNFRMQKPANALALRAFYLVAGIGFEPMTFRL